MLSHLCDELNAFCAAYELEPMSADDLLMTLPDEVREDNLIELQKSYLVNFIARWDIAEKLDAQ